MMSDGKERARCFAVAPSPSLTQPHTHLGLARRDGAVHGGGGVGGHGGKAKREGSSAARWERETPGRCGEKRRVRKPTAVSKTFFSTTRPPLHTRATHTRVTRTHTHAHNDHHRLSPSPHSPVRPRRPRLPGGRGQTASAAYDDVAAGAAGELLFLGGETEGSVLLVHANARGIRGRTCVEFGREADLVPGPGGDVRAIQFGARPHAPDFAHASLSPPPISGLPPGRSRGRAQGRRKVPADERGEW